MNEDLPSNEVLRTPKRSERLRQRAAWMYFVEEMTQSAIADALGVGRVTVVRMLAEAKALGEVRIALSRGDAELGGLEAALCNNFGLSDAIVAPLSSDSADPTAPIAAALGDHVSALLRNDMKIGLGWGRTLNSLEHLSERSKGLSVVSGRRPPISWPTTQLSFRPASRAPSTPIATHSFSLPRRQLSHWRP
jgi:DNA-binding transcriptional regulator LsrR (DeoR family)